MALVDVGVARFLVAEPALLAADLRDGTAERWWSDLDLEVYADRGDEGLRWTVTGAWVGTAEVWLQPHRDGAVAHAFLRVDPAPGRQVGPRAAARSAAARARHLSAGLGAWKRRREGDRSPGTPRVPDPRVQAVRDGSVDAGVVPPLPGRAATRRQPVPRSSAS